MAQVNVTISGKTYRMACDDGQEDHLRALAAQLEQIIGALRKTFGEIGDQRLTVMAAITLADTLSEARSRVAELEGDLALSEKARITAERARDAADAGAARIVEAAAERVASAASRLNRLV